MFKVQTKWSMDYWNLNPWCVGYESSLKTLAFRRCLNLTTFNYLKQSILKLNRFCKFDRPWIGFYFFRIILENKINKYAFMKSFENKVFAVKNSHHVKTSENDENFEKCSMQILSVEK